MNDRPRSAADAGDDWLEAVLRAEGAAHREEYVHDAGFTAKVMAALPTPVALPAWRRPALTLLWALLGLGIALALPGVVVDVLRDALRDVLRVLLGQSVSLTGIGAAVVAMVVAAWAAAAFALRDD